MARRCPGKYVAGWLKRRGPPGFIRGTKQCPTAAQTVPVAAGRPGRAGPGSPGDRPAPRAGVAALSRGRGRTRRGRDRVRSSGCWRPAGIRPVSYFDWPERSRPRKKELATSLGPAAPGSKLGQPRGSCTAACRPPRTTSSPLAGVSPRRPSRGGCARRPLLPSLRSPAVRRSVGPRSAARAWFLVPVLRPARRVRPPEPDGPGPGGRRRRRAPWSPPTTGPGYTAERRGCRPCSCMARFRWRGQRRRPTR